MKKSRLLGAVCAVALLFAPLSNAYAITVDYFTGGFEEGAFVQGYFSGNVPSSGVMGRSDLSDFSFSFSGNSLIPAFSVNFSEFLAADPAYNGLNYYTVNGGLPAGSLVMNLINGTYGVQLQSDSPQDPCGVGLTYCGLIQSVVVGTTAISYGPMTVTASAVPIPAAVWLFGSGLLGLVGIARRKKA